jgi:hypothetical protein
MEAQAARHMPADEAAAGSAARRVTRRQGYLFTVALTYTCVSRKRVLAGTARSCRWVRWLGDDWFAASHTSNRRDDASTAA